MVGTERKSLCVHIELFCTSCQLKRALFFWNVNIEVETMMLYCLIAKKQWVNKYNCTSELILAGDEGIHT